VIGTDRDHDYLKAAFASARPSTGTGLPGPLGEHPGAGSAGIIGACAPTFEGLGHDRPFVGSALMLRMDFTSASS